MELRKEKLGNFKYNLLQRRAAIVFGLNRSARESLNDDAFYTDEVDQANAAIEKSVMLQIKERERQTLQQIDAAIRRIDKGTFGECDSCGEEIGEPRMIAYPSSTLCIDCQSELESELRGLR